MHNRVNVKKYKYWIWGVTAIWLVFDFVWNMTVAMVPSEHADLSIIIVPMTWLLGLVIFFILRCLHMFKPMRLSYKFGMFINFYGFGCIALFALIVKFVSISITILNGWTMITIPAAYQFSIPASASYFSLLNFNRSRQVEMREKRLAEV